MIRRRSVFRALVLIGMVVAGSFGGVHLWAWREYRAAEEARRDDRPEDAFRHIQNCLRVWSSSPRAHLRAARIARCSGNELETERFLNLFKQLHGEATPEYQMEWLLMRANSGEIDDVSGSLIALVDQGSPDSIYLLESLARIYMRLTRYAQAKLCLNRWLELEPDSARALDWRAWVWEHVDSNDEAFRDYRRSLELAPGRHETRKRYADLLLSHARPGEALPEYEIVHRAQPDRLDVRVGIGSCRHLLGQPEEAREILEGVLQVDPDHAGALLHLGKIERLTGRLPAAEKHLKKLLDVDRASVDGYYNLYLTLEQQDRTMEAAEIKRRHDHLEKSVRRLHELITQKLEGSLKNPTILTEIGEILIFDVGNERLGEHWLKTALKTNPRFRRAHELLLRYYEKSGDQAKASEHRRLLARLEES